MSKSVLLLPVLLVAACGNRGCGTGERPAQSAVAAAEPDPALPGLGKGDAELSKTLHAALLKKGPGYQPRTRHKNADGSPKYTNRLILETSPYCHGRRRPNCCPT